MFLPRVAVFGSIQLLLLSCLHKVSCYYFPTKLLRTTKIFAENSWDTNSESKTVLSNNPISSASSARIRPNFEVETDYLGMINFCLRDSDTALSLPSRSKVLNFVTNEVFKSIIIGFEPLIKNTVSDFDIYRDQVENTPCYLVPDDSKITESSSENGIDTKSTPDLAVICTQDALTARTYTDWLLDLLLNGVTHESILGGIYDRGYKRLLTILKNAGCRFHENGCGRPTPTDFNICLSLLDVNNDEKIESKTRVLNKLSNCVSRAMLYGGKAERDMLADSIDEMVPDFIQKWENGNIESQEALYMQALAIFLRNGLQAAENAITFLQNSSEEIGVSDVSGRIDDISMSVPRLRLFDVYQNAFQRVVATCLSEIGMRASTVPQNQEILSNFVQWEQSLRRNLTEPMWEQNPTEMLGNWELIDVSGSGSLEPMMKANAEDLYFFGIENGVQVQFKKDGLVGINVEAGIGERWRFKPGPAHLDTCEFTVRSVTDPDLLLKYVGFIDRGQRIESRFSKRPIRMTGRVESIVNGDIRSSSRFIMVRSRLTPSDPLPPQRSIVRPSLKKEQSLSSTTRIDCCPVSALKEGERILVDTPEGTVIVTNIKGEYYGVNAKCPHLGLPMKKGPISDISGEPTITCNFHNSVFRLSDGTCKVWCQKVMGIPGSELIADISGNFGGEKYSPAKTYKVVKENNRIVLIV